MKMWLIIYLFPVLLFILLLFIRIKFKKNYLGYKWTSALIYFIEVYISSVLFGSVFIFIQTNTLPWRANLTLPDIISTFLTCFVIYEILVLVTINIFKSQESDACQSFKTLCERLIFSIEKDDVKLQTKLLETYKSNVANYSNQIIPNYLMEYFYKINNSDLNDENLKATLEYAVIEMDHLIQLNSFSWGFSVLLNILK